MLGWMAEWDAISSSDSIHAAMYLRRLEAVKGVVGVGEVRPEDLGSGVSGSLKTIIDVYMSLGILA